MVTSQHKHIIVVRFHNEVKILVDRVGGTLVPFRLLTPSIWLEQVNAALLPVQVPGLANPYMIVQRVGAILCQHGDIHDAGVDTVAQGKINDAVFPGERTAGLARFWERRLRRSP